MELKLAVVWTAKRTFYNQKVTKYGREEWREEDVTKHTLAAQFRRTRPLLAGFRLTPETRINLHIEFPIQSGATWTRAFYSINS